MITKFAQLAVRARDLTDKCEAQGALVLVSVLSGIRRRCGGGDSESGAAGSGVFPVSRLLDGLDAPGVTCARTWVQLPPVSRKPTWVICAIVWSPSMTPRAPCSGRRSRDDDRLLRQILHRFGRRRRPSENVALDRGVPLGNWLIVQVVVAAVEDHKRRPPGPRRSSPLVRLPRATAGLRIGHALLILPTQPAPGRVRRRWNSLLTGSLSTTMPRGARPGMFRSAASGG
jgi:hypothetical protein